MAVKNISTLNTQADSLLPDNNQQLITPADIRNAIKDLNDSAINRLSDSSILGLKQYDTNRTYQAGEGVFYSGVLYEALQSTTGVFNPAHWVARSSSSGTWGSIAGTLSAQTDLQNALDAKQNTLSANLPLYQSGSVLNIQQANASQSGYLSSSDWAMFNSKENSISVLSPLIRTGNTLEVQYVSETQDGILSAQNWIDLNSSGFSDMSYSDALIEVSNQALVKGNYYKIQTGTRLNEGPGTRGDIILLAIEEGRFASRGYLITILPAYELIGTSVIGIWSLSATPVIDDIYIFNGSVYKNLTGNPGTEPDTDTANWELIPLDNTVYYKAEMDQVEYDIVNDWIEFRVDKRGNRFSFSRLTSAGAFNGMDGFQWGNDLNYGNTIDNGVLNNINDPDPVFLTNLTKSGIFKSLASIVNRTYTFPDEDGTVALLSDINGIVVTSHADLLSQIQGNLLVEGTRYLLNDFATVHIIPGTSVVNTGSSESLICTATSSNTIDGHVFSPDNPLDTIIYDVQDVLAEDGTTPRKGKIIYRKDNENNLETWYDFRAVKFRRWQVDGSGMATWAFSTNYSIGQVVYYSGTIYKALTTHTSGTDFFVDLGAFKWAPIWAVSSDYVAWSTSLTEFGGTIAANASLYQDLLTFVTGCENISIAKHSTDPYNNIVFLSPVSSNTFAGDCKNSTVYNGSNGNIIGSGCNGLVLFNGALSNFIGNSCNGIIISNGSQWNVINDNVHQVFISGSSNHNSVDHECQNIFLYSGCSGNVLRKYGQYNYLSSGASENQLGVNSSNNILTTSARGNILGGDVSNSAGANGNTISNSAYNNTLADGCNSNLLTNSANNNQLGSNSSSNTFTNSAFRNILGMNCNTNTFTDSSSHNTLGSGSGNNSFTNASSNFIGQSSSFNTFSAFASGNFIGNRSDFNAFGNNAIGNRIGNYCVSNQVLPSLSYYYGVSGQYNVFENYCSNNIINGNYNKLESFCHFIQCTSSVYLSNCYFCSGLQNITFNGTFIVDNLRILLSKGFSTTITISSVTAPLYNNIVVDMKDAGGNLWYKTISLTGKIITKKFV